MTCIVGYIDSPRNRVLIGADSCGANVAQYHKRVRKDPKVFKNDQYIIGFTSSFRMGQLLRFYKLPSYRDGDRDRDIFEFMCTTFVEEVRKILKAGAYTTVSNNTETGGQFLVGFKGRLFEIESDFQVSEVQENYTAIGCGFEYALGSLHSIVHHKISAEDKIVAALSAAAEFDAYVCPPYKILVQKTKK